MAQKIFWLQRSFGYCAYFAGNHARYVHGSSKAIAIGRLLVARDVSDVQAFGQAVLDCPAAHGVVIASVRYGDLTVTVDGMPRFPRKQNGCTDTGSVLENSGNQRCPNCHGPRYFQTVSVECCPDCGILHDYWGKGSNAAYERMYQAQCAAKRTTDDSDEYY